MKLQPKYFALLSILILLLILQQSCSPTEPPDDKPPILPDTTSHSFTWQKFTFGGAASSYLKDVAVIDENNIWAVGEIWLADTSSLGYTQYNAAHWDGTSWELKKIKTNACGGVDYPPIKSIFAFSSNDILFAHIDGSISHFNGIEFTNDCSLITQLNGSANKIWGRSRNDFYVVSDFGFLAHYQNGIWEKIQSGTTLNINDVWGTVNNSTTTVLAAASNLGTSDPQKLIRIVGNTLDTLDWSPKKTLYTVWFNDLNTIYAGGDGLYVNKGNGWEQQKDIPKYFIFRIRGNADNNVFATGGFGFTAHFNGANWMVLDEAALISGNYYSLDVKGNTVALVGSTGRSAVITIGKRQ